MSEKMEKEQKKKPANKTIRKKVKIVEKSKSPEVAPTNLVVQHKRLNETLAGLMAELHALMVKRGDNIHARVYKNAEETILGFEEDITDLEQLKGKRGIGPVILQKCKEYLETGTLEILERERARPENILSDVYGIGPKKAEELVKSGITSIEELRKRQHEVLNDVQRVGLKYYEDILLRIDRSEIDDFNVFFKETFERVADNESQYEIVGSYRRGLKSSGDIDVIVTSKNPIVFNAFIDSLISQKIILEILSRGKKKSLVIGKVPSSKHARRLDFLYTTPEEYPFAVLYFTGSKGFNTVMRGHALKMGYSLNEQGISKVGGDKKLEKVDAVFENERAIFDFLGLQYKEPAQRVDGRSVKPLGAVSITRPLIVEPVKSPEKVKKERKTRKKKEPVESLVSKKPVFPALEPVAVPSAVVMEPETVAPLETVASLKEDAAPVKTVASLIKEKKTRKKREPKEPKEPKQKKEKKQTKKMKIQQLKISPQTDIKIIEEQPIIQPEMPPKQVKAKKATEAQILKFIEQFKKDGVSVLDNLPEDTITKMIKVANDHYYNTQQPLLSDNEYDIVREYAERKYPNNMEIREIGAPIEKNKVKLPYNMPSMDKIKPDTNALSSWTQKYRGPYVLSCKLDGVSGLLTVENKKAKLYTRGDGTVGQDISHLLKILNLPLNDGYAIRGEFIIPKKVFEEKYKAQFANPRNLVSGIINSKKVDAKAGDLHFVAYEIISPQLKPSEQMNTLIQLKHEVVQHKFVNALSNELLSEVLLDWRSNYEYEIDGVIVADDKIHPRVAGNPEHAFAFKMVISDQMAECKVVDVIWTPSKNGLLKPRVRIEPVALGGVTIEYATGFNAKFIEDNKIGIGAVIQIIRSGDVIPYIKSVTTPAEKAKMPDINYVWNETHVDIVLENFSENITVREKNATGFFVALEVEGLSAGNIKRMFNAGYDSIPKILKMEKADFAKIEGFKDKMIDKIYNGIREKIEKATLLDIMVASNKLGQGLGEKKIKPMFEAFPTILTMCKTDQEKIDMLKSIKGIGNENATEFVTNIPAFMEFLDEAELTGKLAYQYASVAPSKQADIQAAALSANPDIANHPLYQKKIIMTKIRDKEIIDALPKYGATLEDTMKKDIFVLIVKSLSDKTNKTEYAEKNGIPIMTPDEFKQKYL